MDTKPKPVYEDFEVHTEWVHEAAEDTLIAYLPGFKKEQLKVQTTSGGNLRISGERPIGGNKFSRFFKEIPIPSNCDQNKISANFQGGMLRIKHPKLIVAKPSAAVPTTTSDQNAAGGPQPPRQPPSPPADVPRKQTNGGPEQAVQEASPPMAALEKQTGDGKKTDGQAKEADNVSDEKAAPDKEVPPMAATMEKQTGEKTDGQAKVAEDVSDKAVSDKEAPPMAAMEEQAGNEKKNGLAAKEANKVSDKTAPDKEYDDKMNDQSNAANGKREKLANGNDDDKSQQEGINMVWLKYKQVLDGLAMELKNPRKIMNMALAVLLILVLWVYLRNAIRFLMNY